MAIDWGEMEAVVFYSNQLDDIHRQMKAAEDSDKLNGLPLMHRRSEVAFERLRECKSEVIESELSPTRLLEEIVKPAFRAMARSRVEAMAIFLLDELGLTHEALEKVRK